MSREWKPGDVAIVTDRWGRSGRGICNTVGGWDFTTPGSPLSYYSGRAEITDARPLVVIDPEDREQVERLVKVFLNEFPTFHRPYDTDAMQAALREFLTPSKPDEPTGLGAVVEDAGGRRWVNTADMDDDGHAWWMCGDQPSWYTDIAAVRVLSEGVTA